MNDNVTNDILDMINSIDGGAPANTDSTLNTGEKIVKDNKTGREYKEKVYSMQPFTPEEIPTDEFAFCVSGNVGIPDDIKELWFKLLPLLAQKGMMLRTTASTIEPMEAITTPNYPRKEIYLPFKMKEYDGETPRLIGPKPKAYEMAIYLESLRFKEYNADKFNSESRLQKLFKALAMHIFLGADLNQKVKFMVTWTKCGSTILNRNTDYKAKGYAVQAIHKCNKLGIKVYNLGNAQSIEELKDFVGYKI